MSGDRTAEIWSTRLQRELLMLSSPSSSSESENAIDEDSNEKEAPTSSSGDVGLLPPFVSLKEHNFDIVKAMCSVTFQIEIIRPLTNKRKSNKQIEKGNITSDDKAAEGEDKEKTVADDIGEQTEKEVETPETKEKEKSDTESDTVCEADTKGTLDALYVLVTFDASMKHNSKGELIASSNAYPFEKPKATLTAGAEHFPKGSDIDVGDEIEVSCDWTPSLHLSDAALNVSLTIRETILRGELYYKVKSKLVSKEENTIDALLRKFTIPSSNKSSKTKKAASKPKPKRGKNEALQIGDIIDLNQPPYNMCAGMYSCKAIRRPQFMEAAIAKYTMSLTSSSNANTGCIEKEDNENEISQGLGNYMKLQAGGIRKVAGSGIMGTKSMFKSFISSAKSAMEDSFLMVTDSYIVELRSSKFNIGTATVTYAASVSLLAKLKFRRQESISLFFKQEPDDPLIFMCPDSADAVQQIQNVLKRHGVKGKHTNAATQRAIQSALNLVLDIQKKEKELGSDPSVENVDRIMSLYRQAAERFESAGDARHEEVMNHMRIFLKKPHIASILDGSYFDASSSTSGAAPQGEILQPLPPEFNHESDEDVTNTTQKLEETASTMNEHNERMDSFDMDDDLDSFLSNSETPVKKEGRGDDHDPVAELDAMFNAADKELADILNS